MLMRSIETVDAMRGNKCNVVQEGRNDEPMRGMRVMLGRPQALLGGNRFRVNGVKSPLYFAFLLLSSVSSVKDIQNQVTCFPKVCIT